MIPLSIFLLVVPPSMLYVGIGLVINTWGPVSGITAMSVFAGWYVALCFVSLLSFGDSE